MKKIFFLIIFISTSLFPQTKLFETGLYEVINSDSCKDSNSYLEYLSQQLCLGQNPVINVSEFDSIKIASADFNGKKIFALTIKLNKPATKRFEEITTKNIGKRLALVINNEIIIAPIVKATIPSGVISIEDTEGRIKELEKLLKGEKRNSKK